ncbi:MAG: hypothetical protein ACRYFZ_15990 [Janthinobacterium lividum]
MPPVTIYASTQARPALLTFALDLQRQHCQVRLCTLGQLPPPCRGRRASLRLEQAGLLQDERTIRWTLSQYAEGHRLPDAAREDDLRSDLDVTLWQLQRVAAKLHALTAGEARP